MKLKSVWIKMGVIFLLIAAAIDIVYLNYRVLTAQKMIVTPPISQNTLVEQDKTQIDSTGESTNTAGYNNSINEATAALTLRIEEIEKTLKNQFPPSASQAGYPKVLKNITSRLVVELRLLAPGLTCQELRHMWCQQIMGH